MGMGKFGNSKRDYLIVQCISKYLIIYTKFEAIGDKEGSKHNLMLH